MADRTKPPEKQSETVNLVPTRVKPAEQSRDNPFYVLPVGIGSRDNSTPERALNSTFLSFTSSHRSYTEDITVGMDINRSASPPHIKLSVSSSGRKSANPFNPQQLSDPYSFSIKATPDPFEISATTSSGQTYKVKFQLTDDLKINILGPSGKVVKTLDMDRNSADRDLGLVLLSAVAAQFKEQVDKSKGVLTGSDYSFRDMVGGCVSRLM